MHEKLKSESLLSSIMLINQTNVFFFNVMLFMSIQYKRTLPINLGKKSAPEDAA